MKKFLYYFIGTLVLVFLWTKVILPLLESSGKKDRVVEFTKPTIVKEQKYYSYMGAFFKEWTTKDYNPLGYKWSYSIEKETGYLEYKESGPLFILEEDLYNEFKKYANFDALVTSKLFFDIQNQMEECQDDKEVKCNLRLKSYLIQ